MAESSQTVFESGVSELRRAGEIIRNRREAKDPRRTTIPRANQTRAPLSVAQQQIWLFDQVTDAGALYNLSAAVRIKGPLERGALEAAIHELVRRHESLRTRFELDDGRVVQVIDPVRAHPGGVADLNGR